MFYLLDTNICIYIIKNRPESVFTKLKTISPGDAGVSVITVAELQYGAQKSAHPAKNLQALSKFLIPLMVLDFDFNATKAYGIIRSKLEKSGKPIGPMDLLIGSHARSLDAVLVTNNQKEFERIDGLKIENWVE